MCCVSLREREGGAMNERGWSANPSKCLKDTSTDPCLVAVFGDWNNRKQTPKLCLMGRIYHELKHCSSILHGIELSRRSAFEGGYHFNQMLKQS